MLTDNGRSRFVGAEFRAVGQHTVQYLAELAGKRDLGLGAHLVSRRFDEAVPKLLLKIQEYPRFPEPYRYLAACYAHMGRLDEAREIVARLRTITSLVVPNASYLRNAEHRELFLSGLRLAAGEGT